MVWKVRHPARTLWRMRALFSVVRWLGQLVLWALRSQRELLQHLEVFAMPARPQQTLYTQWSACKGHMQAATVKLVALR